MPKRSERQRAKDRAWQWFSKYIRLKYSKDGMCTCITCGVVRPIKEMQAGHGIGGRGAGILFEEKVVRPQCPTCNLPPPRGKGGNYNIYVPWIIDTYGRDVYDMLLSNSKKAVKLTIADLRELSDYYRQQVKELEAA